MLLTRGGYFAQDIRVDHHKGAIGFFVLNGKGGKYLWCYSFGLNQNCFYGYGFERNQVQGFVDEKRPIFIFWAGLHEGFDLNKIVI